MLPCKWNMRTQKNITIKIHWDDEFFNDFLHGSPLGKANQISIRSQMCFILDGFSWFPHVGNLRKTPPDGMNIIVVLGKHDEQ